MAQHLACSLQSGYHFESTRIHWRSEINDIFSKTCPIQLITVHQVRFSISWPRWGQKRLFWSEGVSCYFLWMWSDQCNPTSYQSHKRDRYKYYLCLYTLRSIKEKGDHCILGKSTKRLILYGLVHIKEKLCSKHNVQNKINAPTRTDSRSKFFQFHAVFRK